MHRIRLRTYPVFSFLKYVFRMMECLNAQFCPFWKGPLILKKSSINPFHAGLDVNMQDGLHQHTDATAYLPCVPNEEVFRVVWSVVCGLSQQTYGAKTLMPCLQDKRVRKMHVVWLLEDVANSAKLAHGSRQVSTVHLVQRNMRTD